MYAGTEAINPRLNVEYNQDSSNTRGSIGKTSEEMRAVAENEVAEARCCCLKGGSR
jgi:hypothetical protein